jgi:hypothetical protein
MATATATGYLELNIAGFDKAISSAKKMLVGLAGAFAGFKLAEFFKEGISNAINFGNEMHHAAQKIGGMDAGVLLITQKALENAGLSAGEARTQINGMVESGQKLGTLFKGGDTAAALQASAASYGSAAGILSRSATAISKVFEMMESIGSKVQTYFLAMTEGFVKPLTAVLQYLNQIDLAAAGAAFGKSIADAATILIGLVKNGDVGVVLGLSIKVGFMNAVEYLTKALKDLFSSDGIGKGLGSTLKEYGEAFRLLFVGIANSFAGAALKALIAGLRDMHILGIEIFNQGDMNALNMKGNEMEDRGERNTSASNRAFASIESSGGGFVSGLMKGLTTETSVARVELAAAIASAEKTGKALVDSGVSKAGKKFEVNQAAIGTQEPYKVIADSLAKVGGGGGFISSSMSIEAREAVKANQARALQLQVLNNINDGVQRFAQPVMLN